MRTEQKDIFVIEASIKGWNIGRCTNSYTNSYELVLVDERGCEFSIFVNADFAKYAQDTMITGGKIKLEVSLVSR